MATEILNCALPDAGPVEARIRPVAINLLLPRQQWSYSFDLAGRLIGAFFQQAHHLQPLSRVQSIEWFIQQH